MAPPPSVNVIQVCSVAPPPGATISSKPTSLPLTFFDILWLRLPPVERLFFYEFPNPTTTSFVDSVLPNLKHSLALTLQQFLPLAGNITWPLDSPKPIIKYVPGDAVSFTIAESNADFNHLCSDLCDAAERHPLAPHLITSHEQASLLALQVTLFPNVGFCIGITSHHAAMDGKSSTLFMKSWACASSNLGNSPSLSLPKHLTPFYDRSVISDPKGIDAVYLNEWLNQGGPNNRSLKVWEVLNGSQTETKTKGSFELTPSHIKKLKLYAQSKMKTKVHLSTFSVTCAYVLGCLVSAEQPQAKRVSFVFSVDCRSRLKPPVRDTYFGNCIMGQMVIAEKEKLLGSGGFVNALEGITEVLNKLEDGVLNGAEAWPSKMRSVMNERMYSTAGSPRFEVYGIDFGWGKPKKVDIASIDRTGAFSLSESKNNNGGVEIGLALNEREMKVFTAHFVQGLESV